MLFNETEESKLHITQFDYEEPELVIHFREPTVQIQQPTLS